MSNSIETATAIDILHCIEDEFSTIAKLLLLREFLNYGYC